MNDMEKLDDQSALFQVMAWCLPPGIKPLPDKRLTQIYVAMTQICHHVTKSIFSTSKFQWIDRCKILPITWQVLLWRVQKKSRDGKIVAEMGWESWPHVADVKNYWQLK